MLYVKSLCLRLHLQLASCTSATFVCLICSVQLPISFVQKLCKTMAYMVQDYTCELKMRLTRARLPSKYALDRFCQITVEAIQLRDKHICLFGSQANPDTALDSNQQPDPLSLCSHVMFYELLVGPPSCGMSELSACSHLGSMLSCRWGSMTSASDCTSTDISSCQVSAHLQACDMQDTCKTCGTHHADHAFPAEVTACLLGFIPESVLTILTRQQACRKCIHHGGVVVDFRLFSSFQKINWLIWHCCGACTSSSGI